MTPVPLENRAGLGADSLARLSAAVASHTTLEQALDWARRLDPPQGVLEVVTQDEYTHDVILAFERSFYLVYDIT